MLVCALIEFIIWRQPFLPKSTLFSLITNDLLSRYIPTSPRLFIAFAIDTFATLHGNVKRPNFSYLDGVSGTSMYESYVYSAFNVTLFLPIVFYGFLDQDLSAEFVLRHPQVLVTIYLTCVSRLR